jgi:hypothetical protein
MKLISVLDTFYNGSVTDVYKLISKVSSLEKDEKEDTLIIHTGITCCTKDNDWYDFLYCLKTDTLFYQRCQYFRHNDQLFPITMDRLGLIIKKDENGFLTNYSGDIITELSDDYTEHIHRIYPPEIISLPVFLPHKEFIIYKKIDSIRQIVKSFPLDKYYLTPSFSDILDGDSNDDYEEDVDRDYIDWEDMDNWEALRTHLGHGD